MNLENTSTFNVRAQIETWMAMPFSKLNETEILRALAALEEFDNKEDREINILKGIIQSMAGISRYNRKLTIDEKVEQRLTEAWQLAHENDYVAKVISEVYKISINQSLLEGDIPKIRETDHSQGKKQTIHHVTVLMDEIIQKATHMIGKMTIVIEAANRLQKQNHVDDLERGKKILLELNNAAETVQENAEIYKQTISGIYFSKEKHEVFQQSSKMVVEKNEAWNKWREVLANEEESALMKLNTMVGLGEIKEKVHQYYQYLIYEKERKKRGYHLQNNQSLHMILTGNPGTGKTEIARLLGKIYHDLGVLPREQIIEADRSQLVGAYVGQTEEKTMQFVQKSVGGVLFIDEAYSLKREGGSGNDYGQTAIDTLVSAMTSDTYAGKFAVILAGYPEEMRNFLWSNPGLRSRFPESNHLHLPDYSIDELVEIGEQVALDNDFAITEEGIIELRKRIVTEQVDESFGNARTVKNIVLDAIFQKGAAAVKLEQFSKADFTLLDKESFQRNSDNNNGNERSSKKQLNDLIGLKEVKDQVKMLISFVEVQKIREKKGLPSVPIQLHAIFTGEPGTGKTTVAKIYGQILHELGLLKRGHMVVAGRSDLVAGYTGQTALKTKKKIKEALGGVLFIDEAYSLLYGSQDFGKEAVDALVEEMTKHNENLVVILAGYSNPMNALIQSNPGLASRFKKTIEFPSYTSLELVEILHFYILQFGYEVDKETLAELNMSFQKNKPEGNGRAMKDLVEVAIQRQAYRLIQGKKEDFDQDFTKLIREDFSILENEVE
ncbi:AAA family ATPase [Evansella tamaricis]|uniref:AAA family ATPase n=1 Tax=Evansella tamaricis TaxID=2069301 RepID=A0ABS6JHN4_9BACI|nr:AAA family ATPase [Evansella tamaricis]MBU9712372.1 AAA family ATPase [Evansella tamaricis]